MSFDPNSVSIAGTVLSLVILYLFAKDFFKNKSYRFIDDYGEEQFVVSDRLLSFSAPASMLTSKIRFWFWFAVFYVLLLLSWYIIAQMVGTQSLKPEDFAEIPAYYASFPELASALIIVGVSTKLPILGAWMEKFRDFAHTRASIPDRAISIYNKIRGNDLKIVDSSRLLAIKSLDDGIVSKAMFNAKPNSLESRWATICYLFNWLSIKNQDASSVWSKNLASGDLQYSRLQRQFEAMSKSVPPLLQKTRVNAETKAQLDRSLELLLDDLSQLIVCLVFASTIRDSEADQEFRSIGVNIGEVPRGSLDIAVLIGSAALVSIPILLVISVIAITFGSTDPGDNATSGSWLRNTYITVVLVYALPAAFTLILRSSLAINWPIRSIYTKMNVLRILVSFPIGAIYGFALFWVINLIGYLGPEEGLSRIPFGLVSAGSVIIAVWCLERKPVIFSWPRILKRGGGAAAVGLLAIGLLAFIAVILGAEDYEKIFAIEFIGMYLLAGLIGALISFWFSVSVDYADAFNSRLALDRHEMDRHVIGAIGYENIVSFSLGSLQTLFTDMEAQIPSALKDDMVENEYLESSEQGYAITEKGLAEFRLIATNSHTDSPG